MKIKHQVDCRTCNIRELALFANIKNEELGYIKYPISEYRFDYQKIIYKAGDSGDFIYTVRSGLVKLVISLPNNQAKIVRLLGKGDVIGLEALIEKPYHHDAVVLETCTVCKIPVEVIHELRSNSMHLFNDLMTRWDKSVLCADEWLVCLHKGQSRQRVISLIKYLLQNSNTAPEFLLPPREDISSILSLTRETVSRIIADLKRDELLISWGNGVYEANGITP